MGRGPSRTTSEAREVPVITRQPPIACPPPPAGVVCARCSATEFTTRWQTFANQTRHVRMECGSCGAFVRYLPQHKETATPNYRYEPKPVDSHRRETAPPHEGDQWLGFVRSSDDLWRPVALAATLAACWEALLTSHMVGDRLAMPVRPVARGSESDDSE